MTDENEKPDECDFCGFETDELEFYKSHGAINENAWLCEVCASTMAGTAYHFPNQYENKPIMRQISYCTNLILSEIRSKK